MSEQRINGLIREISSTKPDKSSAIYDMAVYLANKPYNIAQIVIEKMTKEGEIVFEPFLGSGVSVVEALRLNRKAVGVDINPFALRITRASVASCDVEKYKKLVDRVIAENEHEINSLYRSRCDECGRDEAIITKAEFTNGKPDYVRYYCKFDLKVKERKRGQKIRVVTREPANKYDVASVRNSEGVRYHLSKVAHEIADTKLVQNGRLNIRAGEHIRDLFSKRNLLATLLLYDTIWKLKESAESELVKFTFLSGLHLMKYTDYKANSQATYYRPKERLAERNVLEVFLDRVDLVLTGREEYDEEFRGGCKEVQTIKELMKSGKRSFMLRLASTTDLREVFPENEPYVDFVLTDPPYSDQVQYLDYNQLWNIFSGDKVDWAHEIVISNSPERREKQGDEQYAGDMHEAFAEIGRVLKPGRYAAVYFHDLKLKYLNVLMKATKDAGFAYVEQIHIDDDVPTFKVANNPAGTLAGHVLIFFIKLEKSQQPLVISGVNIDDLIVSISQRIIADHEGSATTPQLMDEGITKVLYDNDVLDELVKQYDTVVPILKKHLDYNEQGGLWTIRKSDIDEGRLSASIPVKSRLRVYIPNIVNRLQKEQEEFTLADIVNKGLYPLIKDERTALDDGDIIDVLRHFASLNDEKTAWKRKLQDKYVEDLKLRVRKILGELGKATSEEVYAAVKKLVDSKNIPYDVTKQDVENVLQNNFIFLKKGAKFTADLTGYLGLPKPGLIGDEDLLRRLKKLNPKDFQTFVSNMVDQMGFQAEQQKFSGDGGIDVKASLQTDLGKTVYAIQVKRYDKAVSVEPVRELVGVMEDFAATNGVFITTSHFTAPASEYGMRHNVMMIDGNRLVELIKKYQLFGGKIGKQSNLKEFVMSASGLVFLIATLRAL